MRAVVITRTGGREVLAVSRVDDPLPGPGEALVEVAASGVNFIDVYHREGTYPLPMPFVLGREAAGVVRAVGEGVTEVAPGDRVGWVFGPGSHAELAAVPADRLVPVPDAVDLATAAAALLQGMTAHYLTHDSYPVQAGDTVLVHASAGGMGLLLTRLVTHLGGTVIGTASTPEKAALAKEAGASVVVRYADALETVRTATDGAGVAVAYDGVGRDTFETSLHSVRTRGTFVLFGAASGQPPPIAPHLLAGNGSIFFSRPNLAHFVADRAELLARAAAVLGWVADGTLPVDIGGRYPLERAADAYEALEGRLSTGKLLLTP